MKWEILIIIGLLLPEQKMIYRIKHSGYVDVNVEMRASSKVAHYEMEGAKAVVVIKSKEQVKQLQKILLAKLSVILQY